MTDMQISVPLVMALALAGIAGIVDLRTRRIPNVLTFGAAAAAFVFAGITGGFDGVTTAVAGWLLGTALFLPFFLVRGMGAGDVKLLAALGAWLGPLSVFWLALYTSLAGGVLALAIALARGYLRTAMSNIVGIGWHWAVIGFRPVPGLTLESATTPRLAYAIPTFIGTVITLWLR